MTNYKNEEFNIIYTDKNLTKETTNLNTEIKENDLGEMKPVKFSIFTKGFKSVFAGVKIEEENNTCVKRRFCVYRTK